jgi:hypothetical protein
MLVSITLLSLLRNKLNYSGTRKSADKMPFVRHRYRLPRPAISASSCNQRGVDAPM